MTRKKAPKQANGKRRTGPTRYFTFKTLRETELLAKLGATNQQLAEFFKVNITTIEYWLQNYPQFRKAKEKGGIVADMKVANALYKRAVGYDYEEKEYIRKFGRLILNKVMHKKMPPSEKAINTWLRNRQRELWSEAGRFTVDQHVHGSVQHTHTHKDIDLEELSDQARELMFEIGMKQLGTGERDN